MELLEILLAVAAVICFAIAFIAPLLLQTSSSGTGPMVNVATIFGGGMFTLMLAMLSKLPTELVWAAGLLSLINFLYHRYCIAKYGVG